MLINEPFGGVLPGARGAVLAVLIRTDEPLTGRQIHRLVQGAHSLWSVQEALKDWTRLGLIETRQVGRAGVHTINSHHAFVSSLRQMVDPVAALRSAIDEVIGPEVRTVLLFGSVARGMGTIDSDLDLAVIAAPGWDKRSELEDTVSVRLGTACDVLVFTEADFADATHEPVISDILRDGIALVGRKPRMIRRAS